MYLDPKNRTSTKPELRQAVTTYKEWLVLWKNERQKITNHLLREDKKIVALAVANGFNNVTMKWRFQEDRLRLVRECVAYLVKMGK